MFEEVKKKLGFGCMRLPMTGDDVDIEQTKKMVDIFIGRGFNYFDTAHGYIGGKSETAIRECLTSRYTRDKYVLTDKLSRGFFKSREEIRPFFDSQLKACGVDYFDFYLMHAQNAELFEEYKKKSAYETALELKAEGKIKHFGISFHDKADVLDRILTEYPQIEVVQIQFNYLDYDDPGVQSRLCYETCVRHGKPVIVMEPIRGGRLINLPEDGLGELKKAGLSPAEIALRFAASPENVFMVLSGMSTEKQMEENVSFMEDFTPLNEREYSSVKIITDILKGKNVIPCTACKYCVDGCPKRIAIPDLFSCYNAKKHFNDWNAPFYYKTVLTVKSGKASDCIKCGKCEKVCPQRLPIRDLLVKVANEFENNSGDNEDD